MKEQLVSKDQMIQMQAEMLSQLNQEVEKLKLMLLAKQTADQKREQVYTAEEYMTQDSAKMAGTAKAQVPAVILSDTKGQDKLTIKRKQGKQLIVPDELKEAQRRQKQQRLEDLGEEKEKGSPLIKSYVSLSECDNQSYHLEDGITPREHDESQLKDKLKKSSVLGDEKKTITQKDLTTLQL